MKKILFILFLVPFLFSSCVDNVEDYNQENVLVGTWKIAEIGTANSSNFIFYVSNSNGICADDMITFNADDTYVLDDNALVNNACQNKLTSGTYTIDIKNITLSYSEVVNNVPVDKTDALTILSLFKNEAILVYKDALGVLRYWKLERIQNI
jgi:hypothetical protein